MREKEGYMMIDVVKLYPQYNITNERRRNSIPVENDRRSGADRRSEDRVKLDTGLTKDIFEIKNKVSQIEQTTQKSINKPSFNQNISKAAQNSIKSDQFVKSTNNNQELSPKEAAKSKKGEASVLGMLSAGLGGTIAATFLGVAGAVIATTVGLYVGVKALAKTVSHHFRKF